jgi:hypothetical protein
VANVGTSVATTTDLTAVVTNSLQEGDLAYIKADGSYWKLLPLSTAVASASVVYADTAQGGTAPGRWILVIDASGAGKTPVIVFQPGGVAQENVYTSWALFAAASLALKGQRWLCLDDTFGPCVVPAGFWNLGLSEEVMIQGAGSLLNPTGLAFLEGASISEVAVFRDVAIVHQSTTPGMILTSPDRKIIFTGTSTGVTTSTGPFIENAGAVNLLVIADEYAAINTGTFAFIRNILVGANVTIQAFQGGLFDQDVLAGVAGATYSGIRGSSSSFVSASQAGVPGGSIAVAIWDIADGVQYNDALVAPPIGAANVQAAIDALKTGAFFPVSDAVFGVHAAADASKLLRVDAAGQATGTTTTIFLGGTVSRPFRLPDISGTAVVQQDVTGFVFLGLSAQSYGSNAGIQHSSLTPNRAQYRGQQFGANAAGGGLTAFKSRALTLGAPVGTPGGGCVGGDILLGLTAIGITPDDALIPLAGTLRIQVPSTFVAAGQTFLPAELSLSLAATAGPTNSIRQVLQVTSDGETRTLRGLRAGGPGTLPTALGAGSLWSSGTGDPNGAITGSPGDLFSRTDGGAGTSFYVKESGVNTTAGWVGK